jgi:HK97 gp10 family phage protein
MPNTEWNDAAANLFLATTGALLLETIAVSIEAAAKRICPVDTGRLRGSITHEVNASPGKIEGRVGSNVEYAAYVELGTRHTPAQPYLRPALQAVSGKTFGR